jgi:superfamily I DNA and/or RNA helicase
VQEHVHSSTFALDKEQADKLSEYLSNNATTDSINSSKGVQISTVDAFQGGEKEVIVLSTVRTTESPFMDNQPRINVALTRAKRHLIILGNKSLFSMNELWSKVLWDCQGIYTISLYIIRCINTYLLIEHCLNGKNFAALLTELKAIH